MGDDTFGLAAMEAARRLALLAFRGDTDKASKVCDAQSVAWEMARTAPCDATAGSVAVFAVRRCKEGRQFCESVRSLHSPRKPQNSGTVKVEREDYHLADCLDSAEQDPARIVQVRHDFGVWYGRLTERERQAAELLLAGHTPGETASLMGCCASAVSFYRRRMAELWQTLE